MNAIWGTFVDSLSRPELERLWSLQDRMAALYEDEADDITREYLVFVLTSGRLVPPMPEVNVENFAW